jgi:predicted XRE-type DNA-binding protein
MKDKKQIEFEEGSGNVFDDLGLNDADELFARSQIGFHIHQIIESKNLTQKEIEHLLGIPQPDVSHLMNGHFSRFTADKLMDFVRRLDYKMVITISPHQQGEPYHHVAFGA